MENAMDMIHKLYRDTSGATMVEYGLMITFIALACFLAVQTLGSSVAGTFNTVSTRWPG
jgi:pilus assembly protein Flp/PilA